MVSRAGEGDAGGACRRKNGRVSAGGRAAVLDVGGGNVRRESRPRAKCGLGEGNDACGAHGTWVAQVSGSGRREGGI